MPQATQPELTAEETQRVRECLEALERAQLLVNHAAQKLCSVRGFSNEWSKLSKPHDAVKQAWYMVDARYTRLTSKAAG